MSSNNIIERNHTQNINSLSIKDENETLTAYKVDNIEISPEINENKIKLKNFIFFMNNKYMHISETINNEDKLIWGFSEDYSTITEYKNKIYKFDNVDIIPINIKNKLIYDYKTKFAKTFLNHIGLYKEEIRDIFNKNLLDDLAINFIFMEENLKLSHFMVYYEYFLFNKMFSSGKSGIYYIWNDKDKLFEENDAYYPLDMFRKFMVQFYNIINNILFNLLIIKINKTNSILLENKINIYIYLNDIIDLYRPDCIKDYIFFLFGEIGYKNEKTLVQDLISYKNELISIKIRIDKVYNGLYNELINNPKPEMYIRYCMNSKLIKLPNFYDLFQGKEFVFPIANKKVIEFIKNNNTFKYEVRVRDRTLDDYFINITNNIYDPSLKSKDLEEYFEEIFVDKDYNYDHELCEAVFVALGKILLGVPCNEIFIFIDINGLSSRSSFLNVISKVIKPFYTCLDYEVITGKYKGCSLNKPISELKDLYGKRGCFINETPKTKYTLNSLMLKKLTSGDKKIVTKDIYEKNLSFVNKSVTFIESNHLPEFDSYVDDIIRKICVFNINEMSSEESELFFNDKNLSENFYHCLFNKMVEGALKSLNGYTFPNRFRNEMRKEVKESCSITQWMNDSLEYTSEVDEKGKNLYVPVNDLYKNYKEYCNKNEIIPVSNLIFSKKLLILITNNPLFPGCTKMKGGKKESRKWSYINIKFIDKKE